MKRNAPTVFSALALAATAALALSACAAGDTAPAATGSAGSTAASGESYQIGISQLVQHPALDASAEGFQRAFQEAGIDADFDVQNANGEQSTATTIAQGFASGGKDLVLAIATPAAQAAAQAITGIPLLFTAVTDPVEAGLVESLEEPGGNVTGTSDFNPVAEQLELITEILPEAKTVGVIYASGEVNSQVQVDAAKQAAGGLGLTIVEATVTTSGEVATAAQTLGDVDALYIPTDNLLTSAFDVVVQYAEQQQIPLFGSEEGQVDTGAIATLGINYEQLGYQTGQIAIRILTEDADPATTPVEQQDEFRLIINPAAAERLGVTLPEAVVERADITVE